MAAPPTIVTLHILPSISYLNSTRKTVQFNHPRNNNQSQTPNTIPSINNINSHT